MDTKPQTGQALFVCFFLVLAVLAVFGQTAHFEFVGYDDQLYVFQNPMVEKGLSVQAVGWAFTHAQVSNWIPLTTLSHMLDCQVFGLQAGGHHLVNVFWHGANAVLLFLVLRLMTGSLWRSAFVAAVFAIHPLRAESVAWVSERKDVLSAFFFMLTIWAYVRQARQPSRAGYGAVVVLFALGLLAKSMVATLPFVLLLLDYWPLERLRDLRQFPGLVLEKIPLFALSAGACVATALMPGLLVANRVPILERMGNAVVSYVVYLRQMIFPAGLAAHYPIVASGQPPWKVCLAFFLLAGVTAGVLACRRKRPYLLVGWLWYLGMLFPVVGIIQISSDAAHADRYTYLPEIGLAIAGSWVAGDLSVGWKNRRVVLGCLMVSVIGALTVWGRHQVSFWRNDESLWTRALACTSDNRGDNFNSVAYNGLGNALSKKGEKDQAIALYQKALLINPAYKVARYDLGIALFDKGETEEAIAQYRIALKIDPDYAEARNNLGVALFAKGEREEACAQYRKALEINPDYAEARYNLGNALLRLGKREEAIAAYRKALETTPDDARIFNNIGIALATKGENDGAIAQFRKALAINPDFADARYDLGAALVKNGSLDEAVVQYRKALELEPDHVKARFGLGKALLRKGDFDGAMACFQKAIRLSPDPLTRWGNLGYGFLQEEDLDEAIICYRQAAAAYAEKGRYREATATARRALQLALAQKNDDLANRLQKEIKLYEADNPMRDAGRSAVK